MLVWLTLPYGMGVEHGGWGYRGVWGRMAWPWFAKVAEGVEQRRQCWHFTKNRCLEVYNNFEVYLSEEMALTSKQKDT